VSYGKKVISRQVAIRGNRRVGAVWRGHGLQRLRHVGPERASRQFLLRNQAGDLDGDWFVAMLIAMQFDYNRLRDRRIVYGLLLLTTFLLIAVFAFPRINGAHRWIRFRQFSIQPSEISKLALAIFLAYFLEKRIGEEREFWRTFIPAAW